MKKVCFELLILTYEKIDLKNVEKINSLIKQAIELEVENKNINLPNFDVVVLSNGWENDDDFIFIPIELFNSNRNGKWSLKPIAKGYVFLHGVWTSNDKFLVEKLDGCITFV